MQPLELIEPPESPADLIDPEYAPAYSNAGRQWPVLVLAPTSVLANWEREFQTWGHFRWVV